MQLFFCVTLQPNLNPSANGNQKVLLILYGLLKRVCSYLADGHALRESPPYLQTMEEKSRQMNLQLLKDCTGRSHSIATASFTMWGGDVIKYQVMPDELEDQDFFNWYCDKFPNDQFFENIHECVTTYLHNRNLWVGCGCPKN